jgi:AcrR family transcriptional regulator
MATRKPVPRKPGRPSTAAAPNARAALIGAARELFAKHAFDRISTKELAAHAGVNPAMIHYYFGDKAGLLETAFRETVAPVIGEIARVLVSADPSGAGPPLRRFFQIYIRTFAANPWLPQMIARHVLPDGGHLQKIVVNELAARLGPLLAGEIGRAQAERALRGDLDPVLTTLSAVSLAVFPFLSLPVTGRVFGLKVDDAFVERLIEHNTALFYQGAAARD